MFATADSLVPLSEPAPEDGQLCVLLGPSPGDVELVHKPQWLSDVLGDGGLSWTTVDAWPAFKPIWRLSRTLGSSSAYLATQVGSELPLAVPPGGTWANLLLQAKLDPHGDKADLSLWDHYQEAAKTLP